MSALFDFKAFLTVVLLTICTCTYIKAKFPSLLNDRTGFRGLFWKAARIGKQSMNSSPARACALPSMSASVMPCMTDARIPAARHSLEAGCLLFRRAAEPMGGSQLHHDGPSNAVRMTGDALPCWVCIMCLLS